MMASLSANTFYVVLLGSIACAADRILLYDSSNYTSVSAAAAGSCRVLHLPERSGLQPAPQLLDLFDIIVTDDRSKAGFMEVQGKYYFLEDRRYPLKDMGRNYAMTKEALPIEWRRQGMSVLLPPTGWEQVRAEVSQFMPASYFIDDGTWETRHNAFANFTFTALLSLDDEGGTPPQSIVDCVAHGTVPMIVGKHQKINYTRYFAYGVVKFKEFDVEHAINFMLGAPQDAFYVYTNSAKLLQEFFHMRYRRPYEERLQRHAKMVCDALKQPTPPLAFVAIYSAKGNFGRRMALRDTWIPLLRAEPYRVSYKFFLAGTLVDGSSDLDSLLRRERDVFDDMVFLTGTTDEYPIGRKGLAALLWAAHHTEAQFWLKFDDDIYVRPRLLLDRLNRMQRAEAYWGAFDYSGLVVRDPSDPHYTPEDVWAEPVFPPYARGACLAMSMDLVRLIADQEEKKPFKKIKVEDVSYGFYLWQLLFDRELTAVTLLDADESHFAMDAKCCTELTHPNNCWLPLTSETWLVHHASPKTVRCMFAADIEAGYHAAGSPQNRADGGILAEMAKHDPNVKSAFGVLPTGQPSSKAWSGALPDLCSCVVTPPPHPGQPLQKGGLQEFSSGPRLYVD
eukprot:TRINITY_DN20982_c0_g1_i2.p1 TRINITY_DN20982_c0_g1~~TRINITY_DN20982_c0_g1_i2.p1  ORF type:complete len:620 (+),score=101.34 TRINITY_DN20982_c0_g1_i2:91-1950(+)